MISLIHPSWGRPKQAYDAYTEWFSKSDGDFEYLISIDTTDPKHAQYYQYFPESCILLNPNRSIVDAVNVGARHATGDILVVMSDDFGCPQGWDTEIIERCYDNTALHVFDTIQKDIITLPIMTRQVYERLGFIYFNRYISMFADNDLTECVKRLGAYKQAFDLVFEHRHYVNGKSKMDATYERENSPHAWKVGEKLFETRKRLNFGI